MDHVADLSPPAAAALEVAREAAALAASELGSSREHKEVRLKTPTDLVTRTDHEVERLVTSRLLARFPDHGVLGEETGPTPAGAADGPRWIVDPIDGTSNFAHGVPWFGVSIALEEAGIVRCGVVAVPPLGEFFVAERGRGAYQAAADGTLMRLRVSSLAAIEQALVATGLPREPLRSWHVPTIPQVAMRALEVRIMGAAAVHLAYIAAGRLHAFWEPGLFLWDVAAGVLLVEEAGGRVSDWRGRPLRMPKGRLLASNGPLHPAMVHLLRGSSERPGARPAPSGARGAGRPARARSAGAATGRSARARRTRRRRPRP